MTRRWGKCDMFLHDASTYTRYTTTHTDVSFLYCFLILALVGKRYIGRYITFCFPSLFLLLHVYGRDDHGDDDTITTELLLRDRWMGWYDDFEIPLFHMRRCVALALARDCLLVLTFLTWYNSASSWRLCRIARMGCGCDSIGLHKNEDEDL